MEIPLSSASLLEESPVLLVVYDGPRGQPGADGDDGDEGPPGQSIDVLGDWNGSAEYGPGDAVTSRSLNSPGLTALWIVKNNGSPTIGVAPHLEPAEWSEISAGEGSSGAIYRVQQVFHPFTIVGEAVARSEVTGRYELADASSRDRLAIGVVAEIINSSEFAIQVGGRLVNAGELLVFDPDPPAGRGSDWEPGKVYYLSTSLGGYQLARPTAPGSYFQPMVMPISQTELILLNWGPENALPPVAVVDTTPVPGFEGQLWYRTDAFPGLYVAVFDEGSSTLMWVQSNG